jgi:signal transduction histidine kinase
MKLTETRWAKGLAWVLVAITSVGCVVCGGLDYAISQHSNAAYQADVARTTEDYLDTATEAFYNTVETDGSYLDQVQRSEELSDLEAQLKGSGFYFQVKDTNTDEVVYDNLTSDSQQDYLAGSRKITVFSDADYTSRYNTGIAVVYNEFCYRRDGYHLIPVWQTATGTEYYEDCSDLYIYSGGWLYPVLEINNYDNVNEIVSDTENWLDSDNFNVTYYVNEDELYTQSESGVLNPFHRTGGGENMEDIIASLWENGLELVWGEDPFLNVDFDYDEDGDPQFYLTLTLEQFLELVDEGEIYSEVNIPNVADPASVVDASRNHYYIVYGTGPAESGTTTYEMLASIYGSYDTLKTYQPWLIVFAIACGVVDIAAVVYLCLVMLLRKKDDVTLTLLDRMPLDVLLLLLCVFAVVFITVGEWAYNDIAWGLRYQANLLTSVSTWGYLALGAGLVVAAEVVFLLLVGTLANQIKTGTLFHNLVTARLVRPVVRLWELIRENTELAIRVCLAYCGYVVVDWVCMYIATIDIGMNGLGLTLWVILHLLMLVAVLYWCLRFDSIRNGVARLNQGETEAQIDTTRMPYDLRQLGEEVNRLSESIAVAVEKQMQSERFKAELITNVSHDLKTPLTSIINYIDLLKSTNITDPTALEYLDVLDRKSQRLKKLTEDLVEASKASTGAMKVEKTPLDFGQLVTQALGEYDEKLQNAKLTPVYTPSQEPYMVLADGRHLWRVLDNLLNNCVKYAMPGTRVYLNLTAQEEGVTLTVKNVSAQPLDLTAEELMERFVRGDSSRTTEGSGLGLNIAQNLVELQGGSFHLAVDGDLFKASVTIPGA